MAITDDYIIVDMGYVKYWISDHDIYSLEMSRKDVRYMSITKNNIVHTFGLGSDRVNELPRTINIVESCPLGMSFLDMYTMFVDARARGLKRISAFSDIIINHREN